MKRKQWLYSLIFVLLIGLTVFTICSQSASFTREGFWEYVRAAHPAGLALYCAHNVVQDPSWSIVRFRHYG